MIIGVGNRIEALILKYGNGVVTATQAYELLARSGLTRTSFDSAYVFLRFLAFQCA